MRKIDEHRLGIPIKKDPRPTHAAHSPQTNSMVNGNGKCHLPPQSSCASSSRKWNQGLIDAFELLHTCRGLNFHFGVGVPIPAHKRPLHRDAFLLDTTFSFLLHFLALDALDSALKLLPGIGSPAGGSIFYPSLSLPFRLVVATTIHIMTGCALIVGFKMVYDLITLFAVGICHSSPENWPPVMDDPWRADSLHRFWARDWHQLLRRTFFVYGGYPARQLFRFFSGLFAKNNGVNKNVSSSTQTAEHFSVVLGTFIASGLWHECTMYAMGKGFSWTPILFFAAQTGLLAGERVWRKVTGRKVGGWLGRLWVYFVIFVLSQPMGECIIYLIYSGLHISLLSSGFMASPRIWWGDSHTAVIESCEDCCPTCGAKDAGCRDVSNAVEEITDFARTHLDVSTKRV